MRDRDRVREGERERQREKKRETDREKQSARERERDRDRVRERETDRERKREKIRETIRGDVTLTSIIIFVLSVQNILYTITGETTQTCTKTPLPGPFVPQCVPGTRRKKID